MTRVLANVNHEGTNRAGEVELFRRKNGFVFIRLNDDEGDEVALAMLEPRQFSELMDGFKEEGPRPAMSLKTFALTFRLQVFKPGWRYPMFLYFRGDVNAEDTAKELGLSREDFESHLVGLFSLGWSSCLDGAEYVTIEESQRDV